MFISCECWHLFFNKYRITTVLKVETDIISSIAASPIGWAMILLIIYVKIFKTGVIVFISDVKICLSSHLPIIFKISQFLRMRVTNRAIFFLWIKVSLVIQTLSAVHIKRKMSNLPRSIVIIIHVPVEEKRVL
jgi:hypothetical protein